MNTLEEEQWMKNQRGIYLKSRALFGTRVENWDSRKWLEVIDGVAREIRMLKTANVRLSKCE